MLSKSKLSMHGPNQLFFHRPDWTPAIHFFGSYAQEDDGSIEAWPHVCGRPCPRTGFNANSRSAHFHRADSGAACTPAKKSVTLGGHCSFSSTALRELGTTLSLFQSDVRDYQKNLINRLNQEEQQWRTTYNLTELTGRANYEEVKDALADLSVSYPAEKPSPVDVCLASSMLEVGVDIDRLALMAVVGQPKTTAQYIQVTGRVGPALVGKPRAGRYPVCCGTAARSLAF